MKLWKKLSFYGFILLSSLRCAVPAKILFLFPVHLPSHYRAFAPLIEELAIRGHQITAYTNVDLKRQKPLQNYKEILVDAPVTPSLKNFNFAEWGNATLFVYMHDLWTILPKFVEEALQTAELQALMHSKESFDLIITETTFGQECLLAFGHKFQAPIINLHPLFVSPFNAQLNGLPHPFSYVPDYRLPFTDRMTFWQRTKNVALGVYELIGGNFYYLPFVQEKLMRKLFRYPGSESLPPLRELMANVSMHFVDSHPMASYVRPYSSNVIGIGGLNVKTTRKDKLPQDLQKFMDEATDGVIYFSFGSFINEKTLPPYLKDVFFETLKGLKQRIIWKWNEEIDGADHILTRAWLPQQEILAHPNCKLFITHGGVNSLMEVISVGVPVLGLPLFADQFFNVAYYEHIGVGLGANTDGLTVTEFGDKINKILQTPSYKENAKRMSTIFHDQPQTSLETAIYWVEYVIRHKDISELSQDQQNMQKKLAPNFRTPENILPWKGLHIELTA
uniref:UDP-gluconosyltransferase n=1 Tax=Trialeurodes vaporariorum TaxID=88556 RepID=A0A873P509_TRIVP|nr:UDP-gluconosyltransferase [Trialeurodes vaporariorum]